MKKIKDRLNESFINFKATILIVLSLTFLPVIIIYCIYSSQIEFAPSLFIMEWMKICFEAILLIFLINILIIIRDIRLEKKNNDNYINDHILFFLDECIKNLIEIEKNPSKINCDVFGKKANLCWKQSRKFFTDMLYRNINDRDTFINLFYVHNELVESETIFLVDGYLDAYGILDSSKAELVKVQLKKIQDKIITK